MLCSLRSHFLAWKFGRNVSAWYKVLVKETTSLLVEVGFACTYLFLSQHILCLLFINKAVNRYIYRQGNIFTSVCRSVHGGVYPSMHWDRPDTTPWADPHCADPPPRPTPSQEDTPGRHPLGRHPPTQCMLRYTSPLPSACWDTPPPPGGHWNAFLSCIITGLEQPANPCGE